MLLEPDRCDPAKQWGCVKPAAYSQFARHRCVDRLYTNRCTNKGGVLGGKATFMGLSVRTEGWRYTMWVSFEASSSSFASDATSEEGVVDWAREHGKGGGLIDHHPAPTLPTPSLQSRSILFLPPLLSLPSGPGPSSPSPLVALTTRADPLTRRRALRPPHRLHEACLRR